MVVFSCPEEYPLASLPRRATASLWNCGVGYAPRVLGASPVPGVAHKGDIQAVTSSGSCPLMLLTLLGLEEQPAGLGCCPAPFILVCYYTYLSLLFIIIIYYYIYIILFIIFSYKPLYLHFLFVPKFKLKGISCETEHLTVAGAFTDILPLLGNNSYKQIFQYELQEQAGLLLCEENRNSLIRCGLCRL